MEHSEAGGIITMAKLEMEPLILKMYLFKLVQKIIGPQYQQVVFISQL
jgi:hypothetical protein